MKLSRAIIALGLSLSAIAAQADPVELNKVDNRMHSKYGFSWQTIEVEAIVDNLAYDKSVQLYFEDESLNWVTADMTYQGDAGPGKEIWKYNVSRTITGPYSNNAPLDLRFVLKYDVNGQTYWDNNNGQNYFVTAGSGEYSPKPIVLDSAYAHAPYDYNYNGNTGHVNGYFNAQFILQNLGYAKDVEVHYTFDNWVHSYVAAAQFTSGVFEGYSYVTYPNANNAEVWTFYTNGSEAQSTTANTVEFAVKYTVEGATYWNNNHGANFKVPVVYN